MKKLTLPLAFLIASSTGFAQDMLKATVRIKSPVTLTYSPDNKYLAVSTPGEVQLLNAGSDTKANTFSGSRGVNGIVFSNDHLSMSAACVDGTIKIWTVRARNLNATLKETSS